MLTKDLAVAINDQVVNELYSSNAYLAVATYMDTLGLKVLAGFFFQQSSEERGHALKLLHYLMSVGATVTIGTVPAPRGTFESVEDAIQHSLNQEITVTNQINALMGLAHKHDDYATASFLKWFVDEQVEEQASMNDLLLLVKNAGPHNFLLVEDRLLKTGKVSLAADPEAE
ncbi:ferritin [bacterium]|nr:ferritin [bacterium]